MVRYRSDGPVLRLSRQSPYACKTVDQYMTTTTTSGGLNCCLLALAALEAAWSSLDQGTTYGKVYSVRSMRHDCLACASGREYSEYLRTTMQKMQVLRVGTVPDRILS